MAWKNKRSTRRHLPPLRRTALRAALKGAYAPADGRGLTRVLRRLGGADTDEGEDEEDIMVIIRGTTRDLDADWTDSKFDERLRRMLLVSATWNNAVFEKFLGCRSKRIRALAEGRGVPSKAEMQKVVRAFGSRFRPAWIRTGEGAPLFDRGNAGRPVLVTGQAVAHIAVSASPARPDAAAVDAIPAPTPAGVVPSEDDMTSVIIPLSQPPVAGPVDDADAQPAPSNDGDIAGLVSGSLSIVTQFLTSLLHRVERLEAEVRNLRSRAESDYSMAEAAKLESVYRIVHDAGLLQLPDRIAAVHALAVQGADEAVSRTRALAAETVGGLHGDLEALECRVSALEKGERVRARKAAVVVPDPVPQTLPPIVRKTLIEADMDPDLCVTSTTWVNAEGPHQALLIGTNEGHRLGQMMCKLYKHIGHVPERTASQNQNLHRVRDLRLYWRWFESMQPRIVDGASVTSAEFINFWLRENGGSTFDKTVTGGAA